MTVIVVGTVVIIIKSVLEIDGGMSEVWAVANDGQRIEFFNFDPDPTVRHTQWSLWIGGAFSVLNLYGINQATVQRYMSVSSLKQSQICCYLTAPSWVLVQGLFVLTGIIMYAKYAGCDPIQNGQVTKPDQLFPLFVMQTLGFARGFPGLFVASVYSAALSSVSSGVNSLVTVVLVDMIQPVYQHRNMRKMSDVTAARVSKALAAAFGLATIGLAFLTSAFGDAVLSVVISLFGMLSGPLSGLFLLAIFFPYANSWGAATGLVSSLAVALWIGLGKKLSGLAPEVLPLTTEACIMNTSTAVTSFNSSLNLITNANSTVELWNESGNINEPFWLLKISYMWYTLVAIVVCCVIGLLVSAITGGPKDDLDPSLCVVPFTRVSWCVPNSWKSEQILEKKRRRHNNCVRNCRVKVEPVRHCDLLLIHSDIQMHKLMKLLLLFSRSIINKFAYKTSNYC